MKDRKIPEVIYSQAIIKCKLRDVQEIKIINVYDHREYEDLYSCLMSNHHYLGYKSIPLSCLLFGSSAWSCNARDNYIEWDMKSRKQNLNFTTNNTRFLIFPWVQIPHLASHILTRLSHLRM